MDNVEGRELKCHPEFDIFFFLQRTWFLENQHRQSSASHQHRQSSEQVSPLTNHSPPIALRLAFLCLLLFDVDLLFVRQPVGFVAFCTFSLQHLGHQLQPLREKPYCLGSNQQRVKFSKMPVSWYSTNDIRVIVVVVTQPYKLPFFPLKR